ncbi:STAS domain-containing protein [Amycolatopsis sp. NPDC003731]
MTADPPPAPAAFTISAHREGPVTLLRLDGEFDLNAQDALAEALAAAGATTVVDGRNITFCGAGCLGRLLAAAYQAGRRGGRIILATTASRVLRPLSVLDTGHHLTVTALPDEALALLSATDLR